MELHRVLPSVAVDDTSAVVVFDGANAKLNYAVAKLMDAFISAPKRPMFD